MKFRQWLLEFESGGASSANGSFQAFPGANLNTQMPIASKISCKDGSDKLPQDKFDAMVPPDKLFGFRSRNDKNASRKRRAEWIDKNSRRATITQIPPDIIY